MSDPEKIAISFSAVNVGKIEGTPNDLGVQAFHDLLGPVINEACKEMTVVQVAEFTSGIFSALVAVMAHLFTEPVAKEMVANYSRIIAELPVLLAVSEQTH